MIYCCYSWYYEVNSEPENMKLKQSCHMSHCDSTNLAENLHIQVTIMLIKVKLELSFLKKKKCLDYTSICQEPTWPGC